jgi:hypothetical protein
MDAAIYETTIDFFHGRTTISFGPHLHLTAQQFFELLTAWRNRIPLENPAVRNTGAPSASDTVTLGTDTQKENTNHSALPSYEQFSVISPPSGGSPTQTAIRFQPGVTGGQIYMAVYDSDGDFVEIIPDIRIAIGDLPTDEGDIEMEPSDGLPVICFRKMKCCDKFGNPATAYFLCSYPLTS